MQRRTNRHHQAAPSPEDLNDDVSEPTTAIDVDEEAPEATSVSREEVVTDLQAVANQFDISFSALIDTLKRTQHTKRTSSDIKGATPNKRTPPKSNVSAQAKSETPPKGPQHFPQGHHHSTRASETTSVSACATVVGGESAAAAVHPQPPSEHHSRQPQLRSARSVDDLGFNNSSSRSLDSFIPNTSGRQSVQPSNKRRRIRRSRSHNHLSSDEDVDPISPVLAAVVAATKEQQNQQQQRTLVRNESQRALASARAVRFDIHLLEEVEAREDGRSTPSTSQSMANDEVGDFPNGASETVSLGASRSNGVSPVHNTSGHFPPVYGSTTSGRRDGGPTHSGELLRGSHEDVEIRTNNSSRLINHSSAGRGGGNSASARPRVRFAPQELNSVDCYEVDNALFISIEYARPIAGWLCLLVATLAASGEYILGHDLVEHRGVSPFAVGTWTAFGQLFSSLVIFLGYLIFVGGMTNSERTHLRQPTVWLRIFVVCLIYVMIRVSMQAKSHMTGETRSFTLSAIHPLLIALYGKVFKNVVFYEEVLGIVILLIGFGMAMFPADLKAKNWEFAEVLALSEGIYRASFLFTFTKARTRTSIPMLAAVAAAVFLLAQFGVCALAPTVSFNTDESSGAFGFLARARISSFAILMGTSTLSWIGYLLALKFLPPITISVAMAVRPIVTVFGVHLVYHGGNYPRPAGWDQSTPATPSPTRQPFPFNPSQTTAGGPHKQPSHMEQSGTWPPWMNGGTDNAAPNGVGGDNLPSMNGSPGQHGHYNIFTPLFAVGATLTVCAAVYVLYISSIKRRRVDMLLKTLSKRRTPKNPYRRNTADILAGGDNEGEVGDDEAEPHQHQPSDNNDDDDDMTRPADDDPRQRPLLGSGGSTTGLLGRTTIVSSPSALASVADTRKGPAGEIAPSAQSPPQALSVNTVHPRSASQVHGTNSNRTPPETAANSGLAQIASSNSMTNLSQAGSLNKDVSGGNPLNSPTNSDPRSASGGRRPWAAAARSPNAQHQAPQPVSQPQQQAKKPRRGSNGSTSDSSGGAAPPSQQPDQQSPTLTAQAHACAPSRQHSSLAGGSSSSNTNTPRSGRTTTTSSTTITAVAGPPSISNNSHGHRSVSSSHGSGAGRRKTGSTSSGSEAHRNQHQPSMIGPASEELLESPRPPSSPPPTPHHQQQQQQLSNEDDEPIVGSHQPLRSGGGSSLSAKASLSANAPPKEDGPAEQPKPVANYYDE